MRLLHATDLRFQEFFEEDLPEYAILSHRWGQLNKEVSYEDFLVRRKTGTSGYRKIWDFCKWASTYRYEWVWIDTCCIDKRSSQEVSEAINSMYSWYQRSRECVVYLADIHSTGQDLTASDWFNRGWTLQELIAPQYLLFVTYDWKSVGRKEDPTIARAISAHTGIPVRVLKQPEIVHDVSVARRLSWAARRRTTKAEDMAYCLLGLLDVNMPLLYGEGKKAFQRLQLQILDQYDDESIFAWAETSPTPESALRGLLARSPSQFANCGSVVLLKSSQHEPTQSMQVTSRDVRFYGGLLQSRRTKSRDSEKAVFLHQLKCAHSESIGSYLDVSVAESMFKKGKIQPCFIALSRQSHGDPFSRVKVSSLPWTLGGYSDSKSLSLEAKRYICVRTSFSVAARFDNTYRGDDLESVVGESVVGAQTTRRRYESYTGTGHRHSESRRINSSPTRRRRSDNRRIDSSPVRHSSGDGEYRGLERRHSGEPGRHSYSYQQQTHRRLDRRHSGEPGRYSTTYDGRRDRSRSDRGESQYIYSIPEDTYANGPTYNNAAYGQPSGFDNSQRQYPPDAGQTRPSNDRRFSDPAEFARWQAHLRALEASNTQPARPSNKPRAASYERPTACGYAWCTLITCTSEKGHSYAKSLRLKGEAWHEYSEKLLRSGWDFEDMPQSR